MIGSVSDVAIVALNSDGSTLLGSDIDVTAFLPQRNDRESPLSVHCVW